MYGCSFIFFILSISPWFYASIYSSVGSILSLLPGKRTMTENRLAATKSSVSARTRTRPQSANTKLRMSAPAHISKMFDSSGSSHQSDSPASMSDWSFSSSRSPSAAAIGFQGSKKMEISQGDLLERFKKVVIIASNFVLYSGKEYQILDKWYHEPDVTKSPARPLLLMVKCSHHLALNVDQ